jgi:sodium/proline symporter
MSETDSAIVIGSFAVYSLIIIGVGLYSARFARRSDEDFFLAGRSLGSWVSALSASASSESGWVTLGLVGLAFNAGIKAYWIIPGCCLGFLFNWYVVAGRLHDRAAELGSLTVPDFFAFHFRERWPILRLLSVVVILVAMLLYVAAQLAAAGKAFDASFDQVSYKAGVLIGASIVLVYTVSGGFRAVCWTDFLQALLMVGTLVVFPVYLLAHEGGFGPVLDQIQAISPSMLRITPDVGALALVGFLLGNTALGINFGYPGQPHVLVRFMALRSRKETTAGGLIAVIWAGMVYWGAVTVGLVARAMTQQGTEWCQQMLEKPEIYGELGLVLSAIHLIPGVLSGLVLAAVLAAICSTADSQLVVAASSVANDIYARLMDRTRSVAHLLLNRSVVFTLGLLAVLLVINQEVQVYRFVLTYGWAILGASFGPQLILALFWRKASYAGCVAGMLTGFGVALAWPHIWTQQVEADMGVSIYNLPLAFVCALIINLVCSKLWPAGAARLADPAAGQTG